MANNTNFIYTDIEEFRNFVHEYASNNRSVQKVDSLTPVEILELVNKHIDENQLAELFSEAREAALTEIEQA